MDITLFAAEAGSGFPLILLHGNGEEHGYFQHQIDFFSQSYHVWAVDTRGHGQTARGDAPFTIRQFADDLHDWMQQQGIAKAHILGFSDGGNIALCFVMKYPDMVERLIVDGANLDPSGVKRKVQRGIEIGYRLAKKFANKSEKARLHAELLGLMVNEPHIAPQELCAISAPTLVMAGTDDMILEEHTRLISEHIPHARLAFIPGDHFIAAKNPSAFNEAVDAFLSEKN